MKDNFKKKGNKTNRDKVGKILLKDEYGKTGPGLIEKKYALLSVMDTFQRKFEFKSIVKAFEITMSNRKKRTISALGSKGTNDYFYNPNQLLLTRVRHISTTSNRNNSANRFYNKQNYNIKNNKKKNLKQHKRIVKNKSQDNILSFNGLFSQKNKLIFPTLINSLKKKENNTKFKGVNKKLIRLPSNKEQISFTNSINMRMDYLQKSEKEKKLKKYINISLEEYKDKRKKRNKSVKVEKYYDNDEENDDIDGKEKDPFKEIKPKFQYDKVMEELKNNYKFYPYSYLEEHKNIEPNKFKFMIDNFNSKFSLFGKRHNIYDENISKKFRKKINYNLYKTNNKFVEKIIKSQRKEIMTNI